MQLQIFFFYQQRHQESGVSKNQIDQILKNTPKNPQAETKLPDLELFFKYGENYFSEIIIDTQSSNVRITINEMPSLQFNILKAFEKFNIKILDQNIEINNDKINGLIDLQYENH